jgi:hypothetical protein
MTLPSFVLCEAFCAVGFVRIEWVISHRGSSMHRPRLVNAGCKDGYDIIMKLNVGTSDDWINKQAQQRTPLDEPKTSHMPIR